MRVKNTGPTCTVRDVTFESGKVVDLTDRPELFAKVTAGGFAIHEVKAGRKPKDKLNGENPD